MLLSPSANDLRVVVHTTGVALRMFGLALAGLGVVALLLGEFNAASAIAIGAAPAVAAGVASRRVRPAASTVTWTRGVVVAVTTWCACSLVAAVPLYLSGHYHGFSEAVFDAVSGLTNTGLTLIADLDHLPHSLVLLRSLLEVAGGLAFLVMGLTLLSSRTALASSMDSGNVRDERVLPRPGRILQQAARTVALVFGVGLVLVTVALLVAGVPIASLVSTAISLTSAAATTGGFVPLSGAVGAYHSGLLELVLVTLMLGGATAVGVHAVASRRQWHRIRHDLDAQVFATMLVATTAGTIFGLARAGTFDGVIPLARHGVFLGVSAVTTTGLTTAAPELLVSDFGVIAPGILVAGMAVGGMTGSMAGGFKGLRLGLLWKGIVGDVRRVLQPEGALHSVGWRKLGMREVLTDAHVRSAGTVVILTLVAIQVGAAVLLWTNGTTVLREALLTATSATGNVGIDVGVLRPGEPLVVTLTFAALMLLGRLEWLAVFAAIGFAIAILRGRR